MKHTTIQQLLPATSLVSAIAVGLGLAHLIPAITTGAPASIITAAVCFAVGASHFILRRLNHKQQHQARPLPPTHDD